MMIRNAVIATTILAASTGFALAQTGAQSGAATTKPDQPVVNDKNPAQLNDKAAAPHQTMRKPSTTTGSGSAIGQEKRERLESPAAQDSGVEREK